MNQEIINAVDSLEYNSQRSKLVIPEYGRHVQKLVDSALEVQDREERNKLVRYIISVMGSMNPHLRDVPDFQHKLWDQLFIMSDFKLDVDSPFPIPSKELLNIRPNKLDYPQKFPKYRFYGNNINNMIAKACELEDSPAKDTLIKAIANHMKKSYLNWNKDSVKDEVIFSHLYELSNGKINLALSDQELSKAKELLKNDKKNNRQQNNKKQKNNYKQNRKS
ncbi:MAG: DUF4290 domain-containing protein [Bacteroidota bacterium]|nr:DUF4290 domain-containing protein [Bacteroidota bacterium]